MAMADDTSSYYEPTEPDASSTKDQRRQDRAFYRHIWESGYPELQRLCRLPDQEKPPASSSSSSSSTWQLDHFLDLMMDKAATVRRLNARKKMGLPLQDEDALAEVNDDDDDGASVYSTDSIRVWKIRFRIIRALLPSVWRVDDEGNDEQVREDVIKKWENCVEELGEIDGPEHKQAAPTRTSPEVSDASDVDVYEEANDGGSRTPELPDFTRSMSETIYELDGGETETMDDGRATSSTTYERPTVHDLMSEPSLMHIKTPLDTLVEEPPEVSPISTRPGSTIPSGDDVYATPRVLRQFSPLVVETYSDVGRYLASTKRIVSLAGPPSEKAEYSILITIAGQEGFLRDVIAGSPPNGLPPRTFRPPRLQMQPTAESVSDEGDTILHNASPLSPASTFYYQTRSPIERSVSPMGRAASPVFPSEAELESQFDLMARKLLRRVLVTPPEELDDLIADASSRFSSQSVADLVLRRVAELVGIEGQAGQKATFIQKLRVATLQRTQSSMRMRPPSPATIPFAEVASTPSTMRPIVEHANTAPESIQLYSEPETVQPSTPTPETTQLTAHSTGSRRLSALSEPLGSNRASESSKDKDKEKEKERPLSASMDKVVDKTLKQRPSFRNKFRDSWRRIGK